MSDSNEKSDSDSSKTSEEEYSNPFLRKIYANFHASEAAQEAARIASIPKPLPVPPCKLSYPLHVESTMSVRVSPKDAMVFIETRTLLRTPASPREEDNSFEMVDPASNGVEQNHYVPEDTIWFGNHSILFKRKNKVEKDQLLSIGTWNSSHQLPFNTIGMVEIDKITGKFSLDYAKEDAVFGGSFHKKEIMTFQVDGHSSRRLKSKEKRDFGSKKLDSKEFIITDEILECKKNLEIFIESKSRVTVDAEMWSNENAYVHREHICYELIKDKKGMVTVKEKRAISHGYYAESVAQQIATSGFSIIDDKEE